MRIGKKGFSLVEVVVSLAIMTIVGGAVGAFLIAGNNSYLRGNKELTLQEEAQLAANQMIDLIIDVEKDINFTPDHQGAAVDLEGNTAKDSAGNEITTAHVSELRLVNNENTYMIRWQGTSAGDYATANQVYLYEVKNTTDADGNLVVGDPTTATPALMAEHVTSFSVDLSQVKDKRKVILNMTFTYQDRSYDIAETIKLRNDLEKTGTAYAWIRGIRIIPEHVELKQGQSFVFNYELTGDEEAISKGVIWSIEGTSKSSINTDGKIRVAADEQIGENVFKVICTYADDPTVFATATVSVKKQQVNSLVISPKEISVAQGESTTFTYVMDGEEDAKKQGVEWSVTPMGDNALAEGTKIENGILHVGNNQKKGTRVLKVTCTAAADGTISDSAIVHVLSAAPEGKYAAELIVTKLTTYSLNDKEGTYGYKAEIECLPGWAKYVDGYPKITWTETTNPSAYVLDPVQSQYTTTLYCGTQRNKKAHVQASVLIAEDEPPLILGIDIDIPDLEVATNAGRPYIESSQFLLQRNGAVYCEIKNYDKPVTWKFVEDKYYNELASDNYIDRLVGFDILSTTQQWDQKNTNSFEETHYGMSTSVHAKYYIKDKEYPLKLQALDDNGNLVAETNILIPKINVTYKDGNHYYVIERGKVLKINMSSYAFVSGRGSEYGYTGGDFHMHYKFDIVTPGCNTEGTYLVKDDIINGAHGSEGLWDGDGDFFEMHVDRKEPNDFITVKVTDNDSNTTVRYITFLVTGEIPEY